MAELQLPEGLVSFTDFLKFAADPKKSKSLLALIEKESDKQQKALERTANEISLRNQKEIKSLEDQRAALAKEKADLEAYRKDVDDHAKKVMKEVKVAQDALAAEVAENTRMKESNAKEWDKLSAERMTLDARSKALEEAEKRLAEKKKLIASL